MYIRIPTARVFQELGDQSIPNDLRLYPLCELDGMTSCDLLFSMAFKLGEVSEKT